MSLAAVDNSVHRSDATETSEDSAVIEKMIELARQYAAATPSEEEFKALKQQLAVAIETTELIGIRAPPLAPLAPIGGEAGCDSLARPDIGRYSFGAHEGGSDFSARLRVMEKSIRLFPRFSNFKHDQLASTSTNRRAVRILACACIATLIGAGYRLYWGHCDDAKDCVKTWGHTLSFLSIPTTRSQLASPPAAAATPRTTAQRFGPITPGPPAARLTPQDVGAKKELLPDTALTTPPATKQDAGPKIVSPPFRHAKLTSNAETTPTTIKGWTLLDVADGIAVLEGPNGIRRVKRGDSVAGVGRIESIVRWGTRWIVVTSSGLISTQ
jgi:hypothetical protein